MKILISTLAAFFLFMVISWTNAKNEKENPGPVAQESFATTTTKMEWFYDNMSRFKVDRKEDSTAILHKKINAIYEWAEALHKYEPQTPEELKLAADYRKRLKAVQIKNFPIIRDRYGVALRKKLWIEDGSAKTHGAGFRTITLTKTVFAANRNIKEFHLNMVMLLTQMRFTKAYYKWSEGAYKWDGYAVDSLKDGDIAILDSIFRPEKI